MISLISPSAAGSIRLSANCGQDAVMGKPWCSRDAPIARLGPKLFSQEWHDRVQQFEGDVQRPRGDRAGLVVRRNVGTVQPRLDQFDVPIVEQV